MKLSKVKVTRFAATGFVAFGLLLYFVLNPKWVPDNRTFGVSPREVPNICAIAFIVLGVLLFLETFSRKSRQDQSVIELSKKGIKMMLIAFSSVIAWVICVKTTHYIPTVMVLLALDMWFLGQRNWKTIVGVSVLFPLAFWLLFTFGFKMTMP